MHFNEFRIEDYEKICKSIYESKYKTYTLRQYFEEKPKKDFIIMRHDVDYNIDDALKIAEIELSYGVNSTFFIRLNNRTTRKKINQLRNITSEIGLHYDALVKTNSEVKRALTIFRYQMKFLNSIIEVKTISPHGSSTKRTQNTELLEKMNLNQFNLLGDAMISVDFEKIPYYTDAGRTWNLNKNKLNDFPNIVIKDYKYVDKSSELCSLISREYYDAFYLSSHPELWTSSFPQNIFKEIKYGYFRFLIKKGIKYFRALKRCTKLDDT